MRIAKGDSSVGWSRAASDRRQRWLAWLEMLGLIAVTAVIIAGLWLTYRHQAGAAAQAVRGLENGNIVLLGAGTRVAQVAPLLTTFETMEERTFAAGAIRDWMTAQGTLTHVGALSRVRVPAATVNANNRLRALQPRLRAGAESIPLLTPADISEIKANFIVRRPEEFKRRTLLACGLFFAAVWLAHFIRRLAGATGDGILVPAVTLLAGLSLMAMMSVRDPLRDTDSVTSFAIGVVLGAAALVVIPFIDLEMPRLRLNTLLPLLLATGLSLTLLLFGTGPGTSGVKINLFGVQPMEIVRILAVFALASYFSRRWEGLRELSATYGPRFARLRLPRWQDVLPVVTIVGSLLAMFVLQKDLGPALVLGWMALTLFAIARSGLGLFAAGFAALIGGFAIGHELGIPDTVARRVAIWLDPWANGVTGGDQIAHGLWALASGGLRGTGLGLGDGHLVPAGVTDLIVPVIGEETGYLGVFAMAAIYALIVDRMLGIAARAPSDYTFFLVTGCALSVAVPAIVIVSGTLGLMPLTGVVTPFLSFGKSSMICNMIAVGIAVAVARRSGPIRLQFARQLAYTRAGLAAIAVVIMAVTASVQVVQADTIALRPTLVQQGDGTTRNQYNPRLLLAARRIQRGTIYDRNNLALATSDAEEAGKALTALQQLRLATAGRCPDGFTRCYPLGGAAFHLVGDAEQRTNWAASNTSFVERDQRSTLQGYDDRPRTIRRATADGATHATEERDLSALLPLLRHKGNDEHPDVKRLLTQSRDVTLTIDGRLQALLAQSLQARMLERKLQKAAVVVLDASTGGVLASVSYPWPEPPRLRPAASAIQAAALLDRARFGTYPPGSTFKLVTAGAALATWPDRALPPFMCTRLPDGRVGANIPGLGRPIRDDVMDRSPHGRVDLRRGIVHSCNAYFAQLAMMLGADNLAAGAGPTGIQLAAPPTGTRLRATLPHAGYGQGEVLASPLRMARVTAAIASDGIMREAVLVADADAGNRPEGTRWLAERDAAFLRDAMREVVTQGTGRTLANHRVPIAGKTGTAEVNDAASHSWFVGFAPIGSNGRRIAFAIIIENGGYGARAAAPLAADIVDAANRVGLFK